MTATPIPNQINEPEKQEQVDARVNQALGIFANLPALEVTPTSQIGAREILSCMPVRKPKNNEFVMVKPDNSLTTIIWEDKDEGETYFVTPEIRPLLIAGTVTKMLTLAVNQAGTPFIWPVPVDSRRGITLHLRCRLKLSAILAGSRGPLRGPQRHARSHNQRESQNEKRMQRPRFQRAAQHQG
jgi:hypothetical protein